MTREKVYALASVVLGGRQDLVILRPVQHVITMSGLQYESELRHVSEFTEKEPRDFSSKELNLVETLIEATAQKHFDPGEFHDEYQDKLRELVEAKAAGKEISIVPEDKPRAVINLMDALRKSVAQAKQSPRGKRSATGKPKGKISPSRNGAARGRRTVAKRA